ncbi:MAG: SusD/RagB family nutrient-binding outer membrane lipoprotein [Flavobacteriaceae bacterium]|nr:SusD/RagB family nutrient-binding outer membrane lipoprotein [Flavobacteriaceae bacterium]
MKKLNKISIFVFLLLGLAFSSCETTDLDLLDDPNNVTLDKADLDRYLTQIQIDFASFMRQMGRNGAQVTRVEYMFGRTYVNNFEPAVLDGEWALAYQRMFSDMAGAEPLAVETENFKHIGVMRVIKAYTLMALVDFFGDVPLSQATQPVEFPSPQTDPGADVYAAAIALLNEGIALLDEPGNPIDNDFYYENDYGKWKKAARSGLMQAYFNTRLVDGGAISSFNGIASNSNNYISSEDDDFQWTYATGFVETQYDFRHPAYNADYNVSGGAGRYRSNWLMNEMLENDDPRRRYYFYRQNDCTPGASCDPSGNQERLQCSVEPRPNHIPADQVYCFVEDGYWGRDHGNDEGIPPDGLLRTIVGVYPAAGLFDDGVIGDPDHPFGPASQGDGGGGAGIMPIMLSSYMDLMRAEVFLAQNNNSSARNAFNSALTKSIDKVTGFISVDPSADSSVAPTSGDINAFISAQTQAFDNANTNGKWEILGTEFLVGNYGNGILGYNSYRRTGYPTNLQTNIDPNPGNFIRSFFYPANEANVNSNIVQKPNVSQQVYWDNNPPSPGFPEAN